MRSVRLYTRPRDNDTAAIVLASLVFPDHRTIICKVGHQPATGEHGCKRLLERQVRVDRRGGTARDERVVDAHVAPKRPADVPDRNRKSLRRKMEARSSLVLR
nr:MULTISPECIES: hypothetical protein [unclassified Novosphingobium]